MCLAEPSEPRSPPWLPPISLSLSPATLQLPLNPGSPPSRTSSSTPPGVHAFCGFAFGGPISALVISFIFPFLQVSASLYLIKKRDSVPPAPTIASLFLSFLTRFLVSQPHAHAPPLFTGFHPYKPTLLECGLQPFQLSEHLVEPKSWDTSPPL